MVQDLIAEKDLHMLGVLAMTFMTATRTRPSDRPRTSPRDDTESPPAADGPRHRWLPCGHWWLQQDDCSDPRQR